MYFLFLLLIIFCYLICYGCFKEKKRQKKMFLFCCFFIMVYMQWFRDISIYPDINGYEQVFDRTKGEFGIVQFVLFDGGYEIGWVVLNFLYSYLFGSFDGFLKFVGIVVCGGYVYAISRYSKNPLFSVLFILIYPSAFGMSFYVLKQSLAFAIILFALHYLKEEKPIKYLCGIIIASSLHYSAVVFIPLYWIAKNIKNGISLKLIAVLFLFFLGGKLLLSYIAMNDVLGDKYSGYLDAGGNLLPLLLISFVTLIMIINKRKILSYSYDYPINLNMDYSYIIFAYSLLGVMVCLSIYGTRMDRMALYFTNFLSFSVSMTSSTLPLTQAKILRYTYLLFSLAWVLFSDSYCDIKHFSII